MRLPPANCPRCNSKQPFAPKRRVAAGRIETYIICHACKTTTIIDISTVEEVRARRKRLRRRNQRIRRSRS